MNSCEAFTDLDSGLYQGLYKEMPMNEGFYRPTDLQTYILVTGYVELAILSLSCAQLPLELNLPKKVCKVCRSVKPQYLWAFLEYRPF